jgi:hypothetical protein
VRDTASTETSATLHSVQENERPLKVNANIQCVCVILHRHRQPHSSFCPGQRQTSKGQREHSLRVRGAASTETATLFILFRAATVPSGSTRTFPCVRATLYIHYSSIDLAKYCKEKNLDVCSIRLHLPSYELRIFAIYKSPSGNFQYFLHNLEEVLSMIFGIKTDIIIGGDININYLKDSSYKQQLDSLLVSLGLSSIVQFSTRIQNNSYSIIDNIFINTSKFINYTVYPIINGLSDHDAQNLVIRNIILYFSILLHCIVE